MKKLKAYATLMLVFMSMLFSPIAMAQSSVNGWNKLSDAEKAEFALSIAKKAEAQNGTSSIDVSIDRVERIATIGTTIGRSMGDAARELGVAAVDFANTPVGKVATAVIVWKVIGEEFRALLGGFIIIFAGVPCLLFFVRRITDVKVEYHDNLLFGYFRVRKSVTREGMSEGTAFYSAVAVLILFSAAGTVITFGG